MNQQSIQFCQVEFHYDSQEGELFRDINVDFSRGWTGVIGPNGAGKTTLLKLAAGILTPVRGSIRRNGSVYYCPQSTDDPPKGFSRLLTDYSAASGRLIRRLGIGYDWPDRWPSLSFGERKKAQIGAALFSNPGILMMDEPANHLDMDTCNTVLSALKQFPGTGLVVSHNRSFLNELCTACLFIDTGKVVLRKGRYTQMQKVLVAERKADRQRFLNKKKEVNRLKTAVVKRRQAAMNPDRNRTKKHIRKKDHDAKARVDRARLTGKDGVAGKLYHQMQGRMKQASKQLAQLTPDKEYRHGIWLEHAVSKRDAILRLKGGSIRLPSGSRLFFEDLVVRPRDKIAVTGPNGIGKTFFLNFLLQEMSALKDRILYIPQELDALSSQRVLDTLTRDKTPDLGKIMTLVRRLGSDPDRLFSRGAGSPGEIKKIMIAQGVLAGKQVILFDEPVNHLDLVSVDALETALKAFPGCLVFVSHDPWLVASLGRIRWELRQTKQGVRLVRPA